MPVGPLAPLFAYLGYPGPEVGLVLVLIVLLWGPMMAIKQFMNIIQWRQACMDIVELDERERAERKKGK